MKTVTIELSDETHKELGRLAHTYPTQSKLKVLLEVFTAILSALRSEGSGWHPDDPEAEDMEALRK